MDINRDDGRLIAMYKHCIGIKNVINEMNINSFEKLASKQSYQYAILFPLCQIGENANYLSNEFIEYSKKIPWQKIIKTRNIIVHHYDVIDYSIVYETLVNDIPVLENYLKLEIEKRNLSTEYIEIKFDDK